MAGISRNSPCICGSGSRFKQCCGRIDAPHWNADAIGRLPDSLYSPLNRHLISAEPVCEYEGEPLPPGLFARVLGPEYQWQEIAAAMLATGEEELAGVVREGEGLSMHAQRVTTLVEQGPWREAVTALVRRAYTEIVEPFYGKRLRWFEAPQILRYTPGGYYRPHADSDAWERQLVRWQRTMDRHLSLLIYLDDGYEGGDLVFPNFDYRLKPRAGMLAAFPSDYRYLHGAMPVLMGRRHAIVSWSAVEGEELVLQAPPDGALMRA